MPQDSPKIKRKKKSEKKIKKERKKIIAKREVKPKKKAERSVLEIEKEGIEKYGTERYWEAVGRRKTAIARARIFTKGRKEFLINTKPYQKYFSTLELWQIASDPLKKMKLLDRFRILIKVKGGGYHSQAEAVRHAIARVLVKFNPNFRKKLKKAGFLTRDPRMRERKKPGLKRARRAPQWKKR